MRLITLMAFIFFYQFLEAQSCTTLGQLPSSAFPICGTTTFQQLTVPICSTHNLNVPGCSGVPGAASYQDKNPFWYQFTCYVSGSLGFVITPKNLGDDYDWQLYDITGHDPSAVFTDPSLIVTGNWSGSYGLTGASNNGVPFIQCGSVPADNLNTFSTMPKLITGHTYLLLVSHYSDSQSGYNLSFGGGTAVIKDPKIPSMATAESSCGGDIIRLKLNKHVKCATIASDGSDFNITPGNPLISGAVGIGCSSAFDTDSIEVHLNTFLPPGNYFINVQSGSDLNTLLDDCDNAVPVNNQLPFKVLPQTPSPLDSIRPLKCAPAELHLVFSKAITCSSIAADGSDFSITGSYPATIVSATGNCGSGQSASKEITITLSAPMQVAGNFTLMLNIGTDGNTIVNECGISTPQGSALNFTVKYTVNADFTFIKTYGCTTDTINFQHPGGNGVNLWNWNMDENNISTLQNPQALYNSFTSKNIKLIVSNGFCSDSSIQTIALTNYLKADFSVYSDLCPNEPVQFTNASQGINLQYTWSFGDGTKANIPSPIHIFQGPTVSTNLLISLTATDSIGCTNTIQKPVIVYSSCYLAVPTAFTPNNDGKNDLLHPLNAVKADQLDFKVYNRWGQLVFETKDWKRGWDGTYNGQPQASGIYVWFLHFVDRDTHESRFMKGTSALIR